MPPYPQQQQATARGFQFQGQGMGGYPAAPNPFGTPGRSGGGGFGSIPSYHAPFGYPQQRNPIQMPQRAPQGRVGPNQGFGYQQAPQMAQRAPQGQPGAQQGLTQRPGAPPVYAQIIDGGIMGWPDHDSSMTDWFAPKGTPVKAPVDGTIVSSGSGYFGREGLIMRSDDGAMWGMAHVDGRAQPGQRVRAGQPVAIINDDSLPGSYQHVSIKVNGRGAVPFLAEMGARAERKPTSGPSKGGNWMSQGPLQGQGQGYGGGFGGGMPGMPGMPPFGGMPPMMGMGGGMPFGRMPGPFGMPGMPPMMPGMNPFMMMGMNPMMGMPFGMMR